MKTAHLAPIAVIAAVLCLCEPGTSTPVRVKRQDKPECDEDKDCGPHARCVIIKEIATCACEIGYIIRGSTHCTEARTPRKTSVESVPSTPTIPTVPSSPTSTNAKEAHTPRKTSVESVPSTPTIPTVPSSPLSTNAKAAHTPRKTSVESVPSTPTIPTVPSSPTSTSAKALEGQNPSSTLPSTTTTVKAVPNSPTSQGGVGVTEGTNIVISKCITNDDCGQHGLCVNVQGGDICACQLGYTLSQSQCTEVHNTSSISLEKTSTTLPPTTTKVTTRSTPPPTQGVDKSTTVQIKIIPECSTDAECGQYGMCVNVQGRDICACDLGYIREKTQCTATTPKVMISSTSPPTQGVVNGTTVQIKKGQNSSDSNLVEPSPPSEEGDNRTKLTATDGASEPGELIEGSSSVGGHIIVYVTTVIVVVAILYIGYQYRAKVTAFVLEVKNKSSRKRAPGGGPDYHKITDNVEDTMPSLAQAESVKNYVY